MINVQLFLRPWMLNTKLPFTTWREILFLLKDLFQMILCQWRLPWHSSFPPPSQSQTHTSKHISTDLITLFPQYFTHSFITVLITIICIWLFICHASHCITSSSRGSKWTFFYLYSHSLAQNLVYSKTQ